MGNERRHITISGELGSGKSTIARELAKLYGHRVVSAGDINRSIAASLKLNEVEVNLLAEKDASIDKKVDSATRALAASTQPTIFDAHIAWKIVDKAFKVHLLIDPDVAARRLFEDRSTVVEDYSSVAEAKDALAKRYESERRRYKEGFGVDQARLRNYDLVVETSDASIEQIVREIQSVYDNYHGYNQKPILRLSPRRLLPSYDTTAVHRDEDDKHPQVVYVRPATAFLDGHLTIEQALKEDMPLIDLTLAAEDDEHERWSKLSARELISNIDDSWVRKWAERWHLDIVKP